MKKVIVIIMVVLGIFLIGESKKLKPRVVFCDVGQGDGVIIMDNSFQMLLDVGPNNGKMLDCLGKELPFWDRKIDMAIISHDDADHIGGLKEIVRRYNVQKIYTDNIENSMIFRYGMIEYEVLYSAKNEETIGELRYGDQRILFLSDNGVETENKLNLEKVTGVRIGHHGSKNATSEKMLAITKPEWVVISVGKNNRYGHPNPETLARIKMPIWRTDEKGTITYDLTRNSLVNSRGDLFDDWNQLIKIGTASHDTK